MTRPAFILPAAGSSHNYQDLFSTGRRQVNVGSYCAGSYQVKVKIEAAMMSPVDGFKEQPAFRSLVAGNFSIFTLR